MHGMAYSSGVWFHIWGTLGSLTLRTLYKKALWENRDMGNDTGYGTLE